MTRRQSPRPRLQPLESRTAPSVVPVGGEFQVNTYTTGIQRLGSVAVDAAGDFVVAWNSYQEDGSDYGVYAQRYNTSGVPQGGEFRVNTYTSGAQMRPSIAMDQAGDFVVAWESRGQDGDAYNFSNIYAQRYNAAGVAQGGEFRVNTYTTETQNSASVAMDQAGNFVVAWTSGPYVPGGASQDGDGTGVYAQRYNAQGLALGNEFRVNTYTTNGQYTPSVAMDQAGDFVVAWSSLQQDGSGYGIYAQRYNSAGSAQGGEFRVNTYTTNQQVGPTVAMDQVGDFVVAWNSNQQDGSEYGAYAQRYNAAGVAQGGEFRANTYTTGVQLYAGVAMDQAGDFVVVWHSQFEDGSGFGIYSQAYAAGGAPDGGEFRVNSYTTSQQAVPHVAMDQAGDFVVTWESTGQDGSDGGVYAQRYRLTQPPSVVSTVINDGAAQRSRVTNLTVTFSNQMSFATTTAAAFTLTRNSDGAAVSFTATPALVGNATVVTLGNFAGVPTQSGSLADGRYTLRVWASQISAGGQALDGNGDGTGGDDFVLVGSPTNGLFRLYGDANGDGAVDGSDFIVFRQSFGGVNDAFDFDGDGSVSANDFTQFRQRFGGSI
jgi:hypothetical protein